MEYNQFVDDVKECLRIKVDDQYEVKVNRVKKNNSVVLDGIVFFKEGDNVSPNIYLNSYYSRYMDGESMDTIANDILSVYENSRRRVSEEYKTLDYTFDGMKDHIVYRLVNYNKNKELLEEVPHVRFLDLAITFHCLVKQDEEGIGTIRVTNAHLVEWDCTVKELMQVATNNTKRLFPVRISTMEQVITDLLRKDFSIMYPEGGCDDAVEEMIAEMVGGMKCKSMYIVSNELGINGATSILYQDVLYDLAAKLETDFYLLPSSIHEVILVPYEEDISRAELRSMVKEVNATQVAVDEVLSDKVYLYRRDKNRIEME